MQITKKYTHPAMTFLKKETANLLAQCSEINLMVSKEKVNQIANSICTELAIPLDTLFKPHSVYVEIRMTPNIQLNS